MQDLPQHTGRRSSAAAGDGGQARECAGALRKQTSEPVQTSERYERKIPNQAIVMGLVVD
jgi:hypothetical protein